MPYSAAVHPPEGSRPLAPLSSPPAGGGAMITSPARGQPWSGGSCEQPAVEAMCPNRSSPLAGRLFPRGSRGSVAGSRAAAFDKDALEPSPEVRPGRLAVAVQQPGFAVVIAETAALEGCGFGSSPGRRHRRLPHAVPAPRVVGDDGFGWPGFDGVRPPAVGRITGAGFAGLLVHRHERHRDVARRLQDPLLSERQASLGVALADQADEPSVASLRSWRRKDVGNVRGLADGAVFLAPVPPLIRWSP